MSADYGWRFREFHAPGEGAIFGAENSSNFTVTRCPACGLLVWTPKGQFDATHNCTILCPYSGDQMWHIPGDPSKAKDQNGNPIILLVNSAPQLIEEFKRYFMYCPNPNCSYILQNGQAYMQRRVETEIQVAR